MAASVVKMAAEQGAAGTCAPQGAPRQTQSEKAEGALARRIALQDKFATGVLFAIVAAICVLLFSLISYILVSGVGKLFDVSFLTGKPEQFKEGGGIGPELFNSFYLLVLTLLISVPIALGGAIYLTEYAPKNRLTHFVKTAIGPFIVALHCGWPVRIPVLRAANGLGFQHSVGRFGAHDVQPAHFGARYSTGAYERSARQETTIHVLLPAALPRHYHRRHFVGGTCERGCGTAGQSAPMLDFTSFDFSSASCPWNVFRPAETPELFLEVVPLRCSWCAFWHSTCLLDFWLAKIRAVAMCVGSSDVTSYGRIAQLFDQVFQRCARPTYAHRDFLHLPWRPGRKVSPFWVLR